MHKKLERILISAVILVAGLYAALNFLPDDRTPTEPLALLDDSPLEQTEPKPDPKRIEAQVISHLIQLGSAQLSFRGLKKRFGTIDEMIKDRLLSSKFSDGAIIGGYQYVVKTSTDHFAIYADPLTGPGRHYYIDDSLDLRYDDNGRASVTSPYLSYSKNEPPAAKEEPLPSSRR